jgi:hypothetical protein
MFHSLAVVGMQAAEKGIGCWAFVQRVAKQG